MTSTHELSNYYLDGEEIYDQEGDFSKVYEHDNLSIFELLINNEIIRLDFKMFFRVLEFDGINIFSYLFKSEDPELTDFDYDTYIQMAIHINSFKIFKKLVEFFKSEGRQLSFIETYPLKYAAEHDNLEMFQILYENKANINQPIIYKYALASDSCKIVSYLESFYIIRDEFDESIDSDDDSDCSCDLHYYNSYLNDQNETLLTARIANSNKIINVVKQLDLPYEILEKIIIHTEDLYLITAFNKKLVKFMYFPETYFREDDDLNEYTDIRYIKVLPKDNLIEYLYEMVTIMIYRDNTTLFEFLHEIYTQLDLEDEYNRENFISLSVEFNRIEIFDYLLDYNLDNNICIKISEYNLLKAAYHNNTQMFKTLHQNGIKVKYESVIDNAQKNNCYDLLYYLESIYYATCPCCDTINEYDSDDSD